MDFILLLIIPGIISLVLTPLVIRLALQYGFVDDPKTENHPALLHSKILPRAGGVAPFLAILATVGVFLPFEKHVWGMILGTGVLVIVDTLDDKFGLHPLVRLGTGFLAAAIVVISGVGISSLNIPYLGTLNLNLIDIPIMVFGEHHFYPLADLLAIIWIMTVTNFVNWSSGVDGQLPTIVIISLIFIALLASRFTGYDESQWTIIKICLITIGAVIPLLIFNWHPALILPGDGASTSLALIIATLSIFSGSKTATAILILGIPMIDGLFTVGRRIYHRRLPIWGDRLHLHHRLLDSGMKHNQIAIFYGVITFILGMIAIYSSYVTKFWAIIGTIVFLIVLTISLGIISRKKIDRQLNPNG